MLIDIIINVYNAEDYLANCLDSVFKQTIKDKCLITIIDDGSSCNYENILKKYHSKLNIKYIKLNKNKGIGKARNIGLKNTSLPFLTFLDSDDILFAANSLEILLNLIKKNDECITSYRKELREDKIIEHYGHLHGKLYRRNYLKKHKIKFSKRKMGEDVLFNLNVYEKMEANNFIRSTNEVVYLWSKNNNLSLTQINKNIIKDLKIAYVFAKKISKIKNKIYFDIALISMEGLFNIYKNNNLSIDEINILYKYSNKIYKLIDKSVENTLNNISNDTYYQELKKFIILIKNY